MNFHLVSLGVSMLRRDWRAGEWRILLLALLLATGSISTVGLFSDRVKQALQQESHALLGADLRVTSVRPVSPDYREEAIRLGLRVSATANFPSMLSTDSHNLLGEILAIDKGYPLRGALRISDHSNDTDTLHDDGKIANTIPERGTIWADERLFRRLDVKLGQSIQVGNLKMRLSERVVKDVDQALSFTSIAPRIQINMADLPATGLVQEGSRITYRLLVAGNAQAVAKFRQWAEPRLQNGEKLEDVRDARPEIRQSLERADHFLGLAALMTYVLAGIAMALAARQFISRHLDACAVMRCLGATQNQVMGLFLYQFILLGLAGILLGCLIGWAVQAILVASVQSLQAANLPSPGLMPVIQAGLSGMTLLMGFTFLPLWQLKSVTPLRVIRRELGPPNRNTGLMYAIGGSVLIGLFVWQAGSIKLGLTVLAGLGGGMTLFGLIAWFSLRLLSRLPMSNRHLFTNLARHGKANAIQIVALSIGGMSLLLLTLVRSELMQNWIERLPPDAPNRFIVNVQPEQRVAVQQFFIRQGLPQPSLSPMVRGRLIAINGRPVKGDDYPDSRARALAERETNLSWSADVPAGNRVVQGSWWHSATGGVNEHEISMEEGIATTLGIKLGDTLAYDIAGDEFQGKVTSLRKLRWDSMQVNFFVMTAPGLLDNYPASYISSFYLPRDKLRSGDALLKAFPNLLVIDTEAIIRQVRHIMDQIAQTLGAVFMFTLLSGLAVLYAALLATRDERVLQAAILRTLGADSRYLHRQQLIEFALLGTLSGLLAAAGAAGLGWILARNVLEIHFSAPATLWLSGLIGGMAIVMLAGWLVMRKIVKLPPLIILNT